MYDTVYPVVRSIHKGHN